MRTETRKKYRGTYMEGSAARKLQPEKRRRVYVDGNRVSESEKELRARERALSMNGLYVTFLAIVSIVCLVMCVSYLHIQSDITKTRTSVASLKTQVSTVQSQNDAISYSINSYVNSDHIYKVATKKLGMAQAKDNQISKYKSSDNGYTIQYGDIPTK